MAAKERAPTSPEGKEAVRFNAEKDAIFSTQLIVEGAGERIQDFEKFRDELWDSLQPKTTLQKMLAIDVIENRWRMQRVRRAERFALRSRIVGSWIEDQLRRSEQLDIQKAEFFKTYGEFLRLSTPQLGPEAFELQPQMEEVRSKLAATSGGLEFLIGLMEKVEERVRSAPYLPWDSVALIFACCGHGNDLANMCWKLNIVNTRVNKGESAEARKKQNPRSGIGENPNDGERETSKMTDEKFRKVASELLRLEENLKSKKQTGNDKNPRSDTKEKAEKGDFEAETKDAPTPGAWMLAQAVREAVGSLRMRLQLVSQQEKLDEEARKNDAIVPLTGADRFLRAETAYERKMYRALSLLLAMQSGVVQEPQLPQSSISIEGPEA